MKYLLFIFFSISVFSQKVKISGSIKDNQNRSIESASVVVLDYSSNTLAYTFTKKEGFFSLEFEKPENDYAKITISCLGFYKKDQKIDFSINNLSLNIILEENTKVLNEVVIELDKKISVDRDTTTIKVARFSNRTEQTVEDILKKLPGIEVDKDGTIKAHGTIISKLLIEGEDLFDKNYKLLSKNLDAYVLDAVQIIDRFEDNPILKKLSNSDRVAINLKLKKDKQNIWFGNVIVGAGVVSDNRWKESLNLGLLRKKIKLFYLADYNNSGNKATDQVTISISESNTFGEDRFEKTSKKLFNISSNENTIFSKSQSVFNKAFFNSLSFTTKLKPKFTLRGVGYYASDNQTQNSFTETQYNLGLNPISYTESKNYFSEKKLSSGEIELKYLTNSENYFTNIFIYKNNPSNINDDLIYNFSNIKQDSKNKNQTFYNHFNHTYSLSNNKVLINYFYFGSDSNNEQSNIVSPFLNQFLNSNLEASISQNANNSLLYFGGKSKIISKFKKLEHIIGLQFENNREILDNEFLVDKSKNTSYENYSVLKQNIYSVENTFRYNFTEEIDVTGGLNYIYNRFKDDEKTEKINIFNPNISIGIKRTSLGSFILSYSENNTLPEINLLTKNNQLTDYRSFNKGTEYKKPLQDVFLLFSHNFYNDKKRFSLNTSLSYSKIKTTYTTESNITNTFSFNNYKIIDGGENYNASFDVVNYFRKLKLATKLSTNQSWGTTPINVNNSDFSLLKNYSSIYKFTLTSYFTIPVNIDSGFSYNYSQSTFNNFESQNITKDAFLNINYNIDKTWLAEFNSVFYELNNTNYSFVNAILNYNPENSKFSYRMILNNLTNQNEFTLVNLDNYTSYKSSINLVPRYLLLNIKYRF